MPLYWVYLLVAVTLAATIAADVLSYRRYLTSGVGVDPTNRPTDAVLMATPFLAFFYPDGFWWNFLGFLVLCALGCGVVFLMNSLGKLDHSLEMHRYMAMGILLLVGLGYMLFVQEGPLFGETRSAPGLDIQHSWGFNWSWWAYGVAWLSGLGLSRLKDGVFVAGLCLLAAVAVLPFYGANYWFSLGLGILAYGMSLPLINRAPNDQTKSVNLLMLIITALFAVFISILVYAVFY